MSSAARFWSLKNRVNRVPGVYPTYRWITTKRGEGRIYRVRFGPMRGFRWRRRNALPFWYHLGMWEPQASHLIRSQLHRGSTFWDIGANAGYHTIFAAREVGPEGRVVAFEPDPDTVPMIVDALELNDLANVTIESAAIGASVGSASFLRRPNNLTSALGEDGFGSPIQVPTVTLDQMLERYGPPDVVKMDIEGGERDALVGANNLLQTARPIFLLSTHSDELHQWCTERLRVAGYQFAPTPGMEQLLLAHPSPSA